MGRGPAVAALKAVPWQARDVAAGRGTLIHQLAEHVVHGEPVDVPRALVPYVDGYARWLDDHHVDPHLVEVLVHDPDTETPYAGRADLYADVDGAPMLLDLKTGSGVYPEAALQLAGYATAAYWVIDGEDCDGSLADELGVVHITPGGTALHRVVDQRWAVAAWRRCLDLYPYATQWVDTPTRPIFTTTGREDGHDA
jgi:hypothetical protein